MKKLLIVLTMLLAIFPSVVRADDKKKITVYMFYGETCPNCHEAMEFFDSIEDEYGKYYELEKYEVWSMFYGRKNKLMQDVAKKMGTEKDKLGVPYIIIGEKVFTGYAKNWNDDIINAIVNQYNDETYEDLVRPFIVEMYQETYLLYASTIVLIILLVVNVALRDFKEAKEIRALNKVQNA